MSAGNIYGRVESEKMAEMGEGVRQGRNTRQYSKKVALETHKDALHDADRDSTSVTRDRCRVSVDVVQRIY